MSFPSYPCLFHRCAVTRKKEFFFLSCTLFKEVLIPQYVIIARVFQQRSSVYLPANVCSSFSPVWAFFAEISSEQVRDYGAGGWDSDPMISGEYLHFLPQFPFFCGVYCLRLVFGLGDVYHDRSKRSQMFKMWQCASMERRHSVHSKGRNPAINMPRLCVPVFDA